MSELCWMVTITDRQNIEKFSALYRDHQIAVTLITVGHGTAASEMLDYFGLEASEKAIIFSVVTRDVWKKVKAGLQARLNIDVPGTGIAFIVPLSSIGGNKVLQFLTENQDFVKGEETALKDTKYELLVVIANQGYTEQIMDAARAAGAGGGTVIHAKGTGMERAEHFLGVSLASEKEIVFIVVRHESKNEIMRAVMTEAGTQSKAGALVFSLPVTSTAGLRLTEPQTEEVE